MVCCLFLAGCGMAFSSLVIGKKADRSIVDEPVPHDAAESVRVTGGDAAACSHRKLLQTAVARTGAPVYRFVECRHVSKDETKLVQVGITSDGLPIFGLRPGDYCLFTNTSTTPNAVAQRLHGPGGSPSPKRKGVSNIAHLLTATSNPADLNEGLTVHQRYLCEKFGPACRVALAVQLAENPSGACEIYHYNASDGTLDWGYFQINSVHLTRPGLNLRDLLDCKTNIDYAYQLYSRKGFDPWSVYTSGAYRRFLPSGNPQPQMTTIAAGLSALRPVIPRP